MTDSYNNASATPRWLRYNSISGQDWDYENEIARQGSFQGGYPPAQSGGLAQSPPSSKDQVSPSNKKKKGWFSWARKNKQEGEEAQGEKPAISREGSAVSSSSGGSVPISPSNAQLQQQGAQVVTSPVSAAPISQAAIGPLSRPASLNQTSSSTLPQQQPIQSSSAYQSESSSISRGFVAPMLTQTVSSSAPIGMQSSGLQQQQQYSSVRQVPTMGSFTSGSLGNAISVPGGVIYEQAPGQANQVLNYGSLPPHIQQQVQSQLNMQVQQKLSSLSRSGSPYGFHEGAVPQQTVVPLQQQAIAPVSAAPPQQQLASSSVPQDQSKDSTDQHASKGGFLSNLFHRKSSTDVDQDSGKDKEQVLGYAPAMMTQPTATEAPFAVGTSSNLSAGSSSSSSSTTTTSPKASTVDMGAMWRNVPGAQVFPMGMSNPFPKGLGFWKAPEQAAPQQWGNDSRIGAERMGGAPQPVITGGIGLGPNNQTFGPSQNTGLSQSARSSSSSSSTGTSSRPYGQISGGMGLGAQNQTFGDQSQSFPAASWSKGSAYSQQSSLSSMPIQQSGNAASSFQASQRLGTTVPVSAFSHAALTAPSTTIVPVQGNIIASVEGTFSVQKLTTTASAPPMSQQFDSALFDQLRTYVHYMRQIRRAVKQMSRAHPRYMSAKSNFYKMLSLPHSVLFQNRPEIPASVSESMAFVTGFRRQMWNHGSRLITGPFLNLYKDYVMPCLRLRAKIVELEGRSDDTHGVRSRELERCRTEFMATWHELQQRQNEICNQHFYLFMQEWVNGTEQCLQRVKQALSSHQPSQLALSDSDQMKNFIPVDFSRQDILSGVPHSKNATVLTDEGMPAMDHHAAVKQKKSQDVNITINEGARGDMFVPSYQKSSGLPSSVLNSSSCYGGLGRQYSAGSTSSLSSGVSQWRGSDDFNVLCIPTDVFDDSTWMPRYKPLKWTPGALEVGSLGTSSFLSQAKWVSPAEFLHRDRSSSGSGSGSGSSTMSYQPPAFKAQPTYGTDIGTASSLTHDYSGSTSQPASTGGLRVDPELSGQHQPIAGTSSASTGHTGGVVDKVKHALHLA